MRRPLLYLLRLIGFPERSEPSDWWTYFGSFGDDIFSDEETAPA